MTSALTWLLWKVIDGMERHEHVWKQNGSNTWVCTYVAQNGRRCREWYGEMNW